MLLLNLSKVDINRLPLVNSEHIIVAGLKGIVSRDFEWLQMTLINRLCVPDVPLEVNFFLNLHLHIVFKFLSLQQVKLLLMHLAKA